MRELAAIAIALMLASTTLLSACAPGPIYPTRSTSTSSTYNSAERARQNLRNSSISTVKEMAKVNESTAGQKSDSELIEMAQDSVRGILKDPGSAQFQKMVVRKIDEGRVVCGEVNAKNSYGGYVGFKHFVSGVAGAQIESTGSRYPDIDRAANAGLRMACP